MKRSVIKRRKRVALATSPPPPTNQSGGSDNEHSSSRKSRIHHPPTPASTSGSERGYISSDDETTIDDFSLSNRKRKVDDHSISNKRRCNSNNIRQVPPIEDYVCNKLSGAMWDDRRRESLTPVEPILQNQVHIHQNNVAFNNNRTMGTPSVPLPSVFPSQYNDGSSSPSHNSSISSLLNPSTSASNGLPQLPPLSSIPSNIPSANMVSSSPPHMSGLPISNHQPQSKITQQLLNHRHELQSEVSRLNMLLSKTTAILVDLDKAIVNGSIPNTPYGSPDKSLANNGNNYGMPTPPPSDGHNIYMTLPPLTPSGSPDSR
ncbi:6661_t:CDS:1 [Cetraspora pellucida]|uniref:6661_t:CDS:1 n=1 Tax=Cetraspora pellucida TaxID=1433469 RepID=A0A9N9F4X5_9GLOM|nr:6661_t:CDS:1 [Cetraspora pellucida]